MRNPDGLAQILRRHFGVPVRIVEHVAQWLPLDRAQRCGLRAAEGDWHAALLGGATLGRAVRDARSRIRIVLGPLSLADYRRFLPGGAAARALAQWVHEYAGIEFDWDAQLELAAREVPALALGGLEALGLCSWVGQRPDPAPARALVLDYAARAPFHQSQSA
jgi:type VI secretion system protein ImpH